MFFWYHSYYYIAFSLLILWFGYLIFQTCYFAKQYNQYFNNKIKSLQLLCFQLNEQYKQQRLLFSLFIIPKDIYNAFHKSKRYQQQALIRISVK